MKKIIIAFTVVIGLILVLNMSNKKEYASIAVLADAGNYKEFYVQIKQKIDEGSEEAKYVLIDYFLKSIRDEDIEELTYYLEQYPTLINSPDEDGYRAVGVSLTDHKIRLDVIKVLVRYKPDFDYIMNTYENAVTPLQQLIGEKKSINASKAITLFIESGADVNFYPQKGRAAFSPILFAYIGDDINMFETLLTHGAKLNDDTNTRNIKNVNNNDVLSTIAATYFLELSKNPTDFKEFYKKPVAQKFLHRVESDSYRIIHEKNMKYLELIAKNKAFSRAGKYGIEKLAKLYAATNELDGLKILLKNELCNRKGICDELRTIALKNNNRAILYTIDKKKN